jgi:hypothetical protein
MKKCLLVFICCAGSTLPCEKVKAQEREKVVFGLTSGFMSATAATAPKRASLGLFLNYATSKRSFINVELKKRSPFGLDLNADEAFNSFNKFLLRDWSASLSFNYCLKPVSDLLVPYFSVGVGQYYIQDSKGNIKRAKENPEEVNLDYDMRDYFRNPGVFGAAGLQLQAGQRTNFFLQTRCSIIFDDDRSMMIPSSKFTDLFNITAGFRLNLN